jgi:glycosyltransferase involved in cell wall biosynthesis
MATRRLGWLADRPPYQGGAELESLTLQQAAPKWAEIVYCPPGRVALDVDAYIVHNCTEYTADDLPALMTRPVIKRVHDVWPVGDEALRHYLLNKSRVVLLSSKLHRASLPYAVRSPIAYIPSAITPPAEMPKTARNGVVWLGRMYPSKGLVSVRQWALQRGLSADVYGYGPDVVQCFGPLTYKGKYNPSDVWDILAKYEYFVFLPEAVEPYGRTVAEAYLAGCKLVVNGNVGAAEWIEHRPQAVAEGAALFWQEVEEALHAH